MAWDIETVRKAIDDTQSERATLVQQMSKYEKAWQLDFWTQDDINNALSNNWKLYTSPEPRNIVSLLMSLLDGKLRVVCPSYDSEGMDAVNAILRARFLEMLIDAQGKLREMRLQDELTWFGAVRGRIVIQVAWIWNQLTDDQKKFMPPILYRALDPKACGFHRNPYGVQWAFHKYRESTESAKQRYASFFKDKTQEGLIPPQSPSQMSNPEVEVIDFWYVEKGIVYNCVLIDDEFAQKPRKSQFPKIPLFERNNDPAPVKSERWRSSSVLEGMLGTWGEINYLHSMHVTAVGKKFFPAQFYTNESGKAMPPIDNGPDAINDFPDTIKPLPRPDDRPDMGLLSSAVQSFDDALQKATFPNALYGDTGAQRAGYAAHMLMSTAARRAQPLKHQLELILEEANELALFMVKKFAPEEIEMYGYNPATQEGEQVKIGRESIGERFDNKVTIDMVIPGDDMQNMMVYLQMNEKDLLSDETTRRLAIPADKYVPDDEGLRILMEKIEQDPDIQKDMMRRAYFTRTGRQLPEGEPDGEATQGVPPAGQQPQGPPPQGPMQGGMIGPGMGSPEFQGGISPDMLGMPPQDPNTALAMQMMNQGQMPPLTQQQQIMNGTFRRR